MRHMNDTQWTTFCNSHLKRFEKKWTTKLEDYKDGKLVDDSDSDESDDNQDRGWKDADDFKPKHNGGGNRRPNSGKTRYHTEDDKGEDEDENDDDDERFMEKMLEQGIKKRQDLTKRDNVNQKPSRENLYKVEDKKEEDTSYYANQYWHKPDVLHESLDELLKSEGFDL